MKIFNWVHRRFNNKDAVGNVKKNDDIAHQFPVENNCNNHVFERWRGSGILAIGTLGLGYDALKDEDQQIDDYFYHDVVCSQGDCGVVETSDDDDDEEKEDESPLVVGDAEESEMEENWSHEFEYVMVKKKERTTLADLFNADSHDEDVMVVKKHPINNSADDKSNRKQKRGKLIGKDARPIRKFNRLMRRMLRRKIHPADVGVGPLNSKVAPVNSNTRTNDDYASLLPTQDANK